MSRLKLTDLQKYTDPDVFEIDAETRFTIDSTANSLFKLQNFLAKYKDFEKISPQLNKTADREFLSIMLKPQDVDKVLKEFKYKYKTQALNYIVIELFNFWYKCTTGQELSEIETPTEKQKK